MGRKKGLLKNMKRICSILAIFILIICVNNDFYAAITVGGSSQSEYQSTGSCQLEDRGSAVLLADAFMDFLKAYAGDYVNVKFNYHNNSAWEQDMKPGAWSNDSIDDVNLMLFAGHGYGKNVNKNVTGLNTLHYYNLNSFTEFHPASNEGMNDLNLTTKEALWGRTGTSTRWVVTYSCNFLNTDDPYCNNMMQGINIMMGFATTMYLLRNEGMAFGMDLGLGSNMIDAFLADAAKNQTGRLDNQGIAKVIYASAARNDTIYSYAYANSKPNPIGGSTAYYSITRTIPAKQ